MPGITAPLRKDPRRGTQDIIDIASGSSYFKNHAETIALWPTYMLSQPIPKSARPVTISLKDRWYPPIMKINWPRHRMLVKRTRPFLLPILSYKIPLNIGKTKLGMAYTEYKNPYYVLLIFNDFSICVSRDAG